MDKEQQALIKKVKLYSPECDVTRLEYACEFSKRVHGTQKRASGKPYYFHPLEVAHILADMELDEATIITALLHDTVEDTEVTLEEIDSEFGEEIRLLVDGVTKLAKIKYQSEHTRQAENFRKLLVAMSEDIRVLLVKLADRLHNMRTLHYIKSPAKRVRIAHETMEIYSPLAERIGMQQMKNELQDLAFSELHPDVRESILSRLAYLRDKGGAFIDTILKEIEQKIECADENLSFEIFGREKTACSIWRKMERKNISFEQLSDIMAFRVLVDSVNDCYRTLGILHTQFKMVPGSFKDFISTPKENGYQSLHTILMGPQQRLIEIQVRTKEMHQVAEYGVAAHWSYKQEQTYSTDGKQYKWIRELLDILEHTNDSEEFLENTKLEMYYDQVFCFTPKGELIALPRGATVVDFAYTVHSLVGHHCSGAKVNSRIVPLRTQLNNGDQVEIITSKTNVPSPSWETFVVTGKAKTEIRRFVRAQKRREYIKLGKTLLARSLKESGYKVQPRHLKTALGRLHKRTVDDLYMAIGEGAITVAEVLKALFPNKKIKDKRNSRLRFLTFNRDKDTSSSVSIEGMVSGMAVSFADCCHPIPGDIIVGVKVPGKGMVIHTSDCEMLSNYANTPERLVDASWGKESSKGGYIGRIKVVLVHESGSLAALTEIIAQHMGNINNLRILERSENFFSLAVDVQVRGTTHLSGIITSLRANPNIHSVERLKK